MSQVLIADVTVFTGQGRNWPGLNEEVCVLQHLTVQYCEFDTWQLISLYDEELSTAETSTYKNI